MPVRFTMDGALLVCKSFLHSVACPCKGWACAHMTHTCTGPSWYDSKPALHQQHLQRTQHIEHLTLCISCRHHADSPEPAATAAGCSHAAHLPTAAQQQQQCRLFTFDLETTGLSQEYDAIIEMAAVDVVSGSSWSSLVRPAPYKKSAQRAFDAHGRLKMQAGALARL